MSYYIFNGLIFAFMSIFLCLNLKAKINNFTTFFVIFIPFATIAFSPAFIPSFSPVVNVAVSWGLLFFLVMILFKNSFKTKVAILCVNAVIVYIASILITVLGYSFSIDMNNEHIPLLLLYVSLTAVFMVFFTLVKKGVRFSKYSLAIIAVVSVTQLLFAEISILFMVYGGNPFVPNPPEIDKREINSFAFIVIAVAVLLCIVSDCILFILLRKISQGEKVKEELRFAEYRNKMNFEYYKSVEKNAETTRKLRHDMANILQIIGSLIDGSEKSKKIFEQLLSQVHKEISEIHLEKYTENSLINAIITNKAALCREKGITYDFDIQIPEKINIEEIDICKAYVNIIDNAINAVSSLPNDDKNIKLKSYVKNGNMFISSKNRCVFGETKRERKNYTEHGFGQKILVDIADKYNGKFFTEKVDDVYTALLMLKS